MFIRENNLRAGFRSVCHSLPSLEACLELLARHGHLGRRKCLVARNRAGRYSAHVYRGGVVRRVFQGHGVGARVTQSLGFPTDAPRLDVPPGCADEAREICGRLLAR